VEKVYQSTTNKKECLRDVIYIIDHLRPRSEFVPKVVEISGDTSDNYVKEKSSVSSSKNGKANVFGKKQKITKEEQ